MRIAIVGSGVAGLAATWALNEHSDHLVNLYESADYVGGHAHTVEFKRDGKEPCDVDSGFIVFNPPTYPNFLAFLKHKGIAYLPTTMTFSVTRDLGDFEWAGEGLFGVFCQARNLFNPRMYRMLLDVFRFNLFGLDLVTESRPQRKKDAAGGPTSGKTGQSAGMDVDEVDEREISIGEYLEREGYGEGFKEDYLLPMTAAIWSTPADKCALDFPARTLVRFFHNHHLMQVEGRPKWLTIKGGSKHYVNSIVEKLPAENLHLNTKIVGITPHTEGVTLTEHNGTRHEYDYVILATHSDTALEMLRNGGGASAEEEDILGKFEWNKNEAVVHWDEKLMPIRKKAWSAWNVLTSSEKSSGAPSTAASDVNTVSLTYNMNSLQSLSEERHGPVLVTLNPPFAVDKAKEVGRYQYEHPIYSAASVKAQSRLAEIQNKRRVTFAGAWTHYGFHEDGFTSGLRVAVEQFHATPPFPIRPASRDIHREPVARAIVLLVERARSWIEKSRAWAAVVGMVVVFWMALERVARGAGMEELAREVKAVRGFWQDGAKKDQ
ncbi:hypothetical protein NliqN6_2782 [Naganishia liquefaciens]|uniref:Amine oxidase domain-containing protein n=1 Tax=Naganishia liquefaciens TaxID=104408 RepID=A0A8H3YEB5_9TREE|nr:hypothetical protein NliqN6_2782 [Naganishia liquefaciens]